VRLLKSLFYEGSGSDRLRLLSTIQNTGKKDSCFSDGFFRDFLNDALKRVPEQKFLVRELVKANEKDEAIG